MGWIYQPNLIRTQSRRAAQIADKITALVESRMGAVAWGPDLCRRCQAHRQSPSPHHRRKRTRSQGPLLRAHYTAWALLRPCPTPAVTSACCDIEAATLAITGLPRYSKHPSDVPCPLPRRTRRVHVSIAFPPMRPSPIGRRVGIRIVTFEACSGFTRVTARTRARPRRSFDPRRLGAACGSRHPRPESLNHPRATFVTRLQPSRLPDEAARTNRQLSGWMESSSTDGSEKGLA